MCMIQQDIERTVSSLISNRTSFTAFNVSQILRNLGICKQGDKETGHGAVRRVVHKMFDTGQMSDYKQQTCLLPLANPSPAMVFYAPEIEDGNGGIPQQALVDIVNAHGAAAAIAQQQSTQVVQTPVLTSSTLTQPATSAPNNTGTARTGPAGRSVTVKRQSSTNYIKAVGTKKGSCLYIPKSMAKALGIHAKNDGVVVVDPASNKISIMPFASGQSGTKPCVDRNNNIRIGKKALMKVGIDGNIKVELDGSKIEISKG